MSGEEDTKVDLDLFTVKDLKGKAFFAVIAVSKLRYDFQFFAYSRLVSDFEATGVPVEG